MLSPVIELAKVTLSKNLRRTILRGHPWIYTDAVKNKLSKTELCQIMDMRGEHLAWGYYDPHSQLCLRILGLDRAAPRTETYETLFADALATRKSVISDDTNCYRLFNGEGDLLPGLVCDVYDEVAVVQFDGQGASEFWDRQLIANWLIANTNCTSIVEKLRRQTTGGLVHLAGKPCPEQITATEHGVQFAVDIEKGQKTGLFLDQRENRQYIRSVSAGKSVLNLFSYTGGFSIYAGIGGATRVASLDVAPGAIESANQNWAFNGLDPAKHTGLCVDVFEYLKSSTEVWDHVIVDPPSMGHSEEHKDRAKAKYIELFGAVAKKMKSGGQLSLSSCSSHITFEDFFEIIEESLSVARRRGQILRVSGQGPDHPFPHSCREMRYLKFVHLILR